MEEIEVKNDKEDETQNQDPNEVIELQSDMEDEMKKLIPGMIIEGFKEKTEYEDIAKYIKDECDKAFGEEFLCIIVDNHAGFGSCLRCAPGTLYMGKYQDNRIIIFKI